MNNQESSFSRVQKIVMFLGGLLVLSATVIFNVADNKATHQREQRESAERVQDAVIKLEIICRNHGLSNEDCYK